MPQMNRRNVLAVSTAALATATRLAAMGKPVAKTPFAFPPKFLWGAATAGHQVEGGNVNSDLWAIEHAKPTIFAEPSGDACDSYNRWAEDLDIVRDLGLNTYRFSLEWARIEPEPGEFSLGALDHYRRMIAGCRERGLTPMVTFNHFTAPRWFAANGGWEGEGAVDRFARYCERSAKALADQIGYATTLNEPELLRIFKWMPGLMPAELVKIQTQMLAAAAKASGSDRFGVMIAGDADRLLEPLIAAHRAGVAAIKGVRPDLPVGVSLAMIDDQAVGPNSLRDKKRAEVYGAWLEVAKADDFVGVQNYERQRLDAKGALPPPPGAELSQMGAEVYPASLEGVVRFAHAATGKPVIVTENGLATTDDIRRQAYIPQAIAGVARAMADGVPVLGYVHWSLLDNYEWIFGYRPRYGLVEVDRVTFKRTPKPSARVLGDIAKRNAV